jgi:DNA mismatch endonuclease (patch repair protein)
MRQIKSTDTAAEIMLRRAVWGVGCRGYRVHPKGIIGKPDIAYARWKVAVFVDGCFWHVCPKCYVAPSSNVSYWDAKRERNQHRDEEVSSALSGQGWQVVRIWEHEIRDDLAAACTRVVNAVDAARRGA